jgi:hypothetical protein
MSILDRLKPQPRWKHADPSIRLEAVRELDDAVELAVLAEADPEAKVRRAAVARIIDPAVLGRVASGDSDPDARDRAADRLLSLATGADSEPGAAVAAISQLNDPRRLSTVAKSGAIEAVRASALTRLTDERALGSIARHATHETTAADALGRLTDSKEILEVALNADHKDIALAAFDRALNGSTPDLALLRSIESRSQQKAVSKRARSLIQGIEDAEAARVAAEEERRRQQLSAVEGVERLSSVTDVARSEAELARLTELWRAWQVEDPSLSSRFADGAAAAQSAIVQRRREAEEAAELARVRAEALATREALCERVETLDGEDVCAQLVPIEEEWRSLTPLVGNGPEADRLAERFVKAVTACRKRHELGAMLTATRASLEALVVEAEGLPSLADAARASGRWQTLSREARGQSAILSEASRPADDLTARLAAVQLAFDARETAAREQAIKAQQEAAARLQRLAERASRAVEAEAMTLREGERLMRDIAAGLDEGAHADSSKDIQDASARLRSLLEKVAPRVRELREMDEWRRFANAQQQEQLIAMAEAIVASLKTEDETGKASDLIATARALRELHAKWHEVAEAPRHSAQKLWERFRVATDFIRSRCEGYFTKLREERGANLEKKAAVVQEAESLAESTDWAKAAARFQELQTEWQQLGPAPRDAAKDLSHRFRAACNQFFTRRRDDLAERKKVWSDNYARKEALCERAEILAQSLEWDAASAEMKRLQSEWKGIGPVRRNKSEAIWNRFRAAADRFFERYHNRHQIALAGKIAERESVVVDLESLAQAEDGAAPDNLAERVQDLRANWNRGVPVPTAEMRPLADRWQQAFSKVLSRWPEAFHASDLDPVTVRHRMEKLVTRVEGLATDTEETTAPGRSQTEMLAARLRSALASNAMGGAVNDEAKWRNAADTVKDAQAAWLRLPPISGPDIDVLESRFRDGCRRVMDHVRRHNHQTKPSRSGSLAGVS